MASFHAQIAVGEGDLASFSLAEFKSYLHADQSIFVMNFLRPIRRRKLLEFLNPFFFAPQSVRRTANMNWQDEIPKIDRSKSLDLERTPPKGRLIGIVTSETWNGCFTHYFAGRTNPCEKNECELCKKGVGKRWHGYLGVWQPKQRRHLLF